MIKKFKLFENIDDPYDEEVWDGPKVYIREFSYTDGNVGRVVYNETKDKILQDIESLEFEDDAFFIESNKLSPYVEKFVRNNWAWLENGLEEDNPKYRRWKYKELVSAFGKENIIF